MTATFPSPWLAEQRREAERRAVPNCVYDTLLLMRKLCLETAPKPLDIVDGATELMLQVIIMRDIETIQFDPDGNVRLSVFLVRRTRLAPLH